MLIILCADGNGIVISLKKYAFGCSQIRFCHYSPPTRFYPPDQRTSDLYIHFSDSATDLSHSVKLPS